MLFRSHAAPGGDLRDAVLFCRVKSWLTGSRLVSLPFSDHCQPLVSDPASLPFLIPSLSPRGTKYIEIRPRTGPGAAIGPLLAGSGARHYHFHLLDLRPGAEAVFQGFHKDCVQRKIQRAGRECLVYEQGNSPELLREFYRLQVVTRRRQQLPPQPFAWFRNLAVCMGEQLQVHIARKDRRPVAAILTLRYRQALVYKYGCSEKALSSLGGTQWLFWKAIQNAVRDGLVEFDLGRTDWNNEGLVRFKDRLGAASSTLTYFRWPAASSPAVADGWAAAAAHRIFARLPEPCLVAAGNLLYRHLG